MGILIHTGIYWENPVNRAFTQVMHRFFVILNAMGTMISRSLDARKYDQDFMSYEETKQIKNPLT